MAARGCVCVRALSLAFLSACVYAWSYVGSALSSVAARNDWRGGYGGAPEKRWEVTVRRERREKKEKRGRYGRKDGRKEEREV